MAKKGWNKGKITFERYRSIRLKMQRQYLEIERLKKLVGQPLEDESEIVGRIILAKKIGGGLIMRLLE